MPRDFQGADQRRQPTPENTKILPRLENQTTSVSVAVSPWVNKIDGRCNQSAENDYNIGSDNCHSEKTCNQSELSLRENPKILPRVENQTTSVSVAVSPWVNIVVKSAGVVGISSVDRWQL